MTLRDNIRRALRTESSHDFLAIHRWVAAQAAGLHPRMCSRCEAGVKTFARDAAFGGTRPAFIRLQNILSALVKQQKFTTQTIADALGYSTKTIHRDLVFLRRQGIKLRYIPKQFHWVIEPNQDHPWLKLNNAI